MLHLINNRVSLLGSVWAVEGISVYFTALKNIFVVVVVVMHYKPQKKNQEQGHGLETVSVIHVFVILSNQNCQTNLYFRTEIAVTPFAVCLCAANRDKTTRTVFPFRFTTRATRGCYETTTYSPLVKSLIMYVYFSKTFEFKIGIHFMPHPGYTCALLFVASENTNFIVCDSCEDLQPSLGCRLLMIPLCTRLPTDLELFWSWTWKNYDEKNIHSHSMSHLVFEPPLKGWRNERLVGETKGWQKKSFFTAQAYSIRSDNHSLWMNTYPPPPP